MRRKLFTQLLSAQTRLEHSKQVAAARIKQTASTGDIPALHEAIARRWKLEHQAQTIRQEIYERRQATQKQIHNTPVVLDECYVTLRHMDSQRTLHFSSLRATDLERGMVGMDSNLGRALHGAKLMSIISLPTPLGNKTYQIVSISTPVTNRYPSPSPSATSRSSGKHTTGV